MKYEIYVADCETTGLISSIHDVIEVSFRRLSDESQRTWCIKPINIDAIDLAALRVNGHKYEDITHATQYGRDTYKDPNEVIIEIENWINEDSSPTENRVLCGHNIGFDKEMLSQMWLKCESKDTFPFGRRIMDTMVWEFMFDYALDSMADGYSLKNLVKKYGVVNSKAHSAESDVLATAEVFFKQVNSLKKMIKNG